MASVDVTTRPLINAIAVLTSIKEIALVFFMIAENELALAVFEVTCPVSLVDISVGVFIYSIIALIVTECACERITVEKNEVAF